MKFERGGENETTGCGISDCNKIMVKLSIWDFLELDDHRDWEGKEKSGNGEKGFLCFSSLSWKQWNEREGRQLMRGCLICGYNFLFILKFLKILGFSLQK